MLLAALAASILLSVLAATLVARNLAMPGAKALLVGLVAELWWLVCYVGQIFAPSRSVTVTFSQLEWVGGTVVPLAWAVFVVEYTGRGEHLTWRRVTGLAVIPVVTAVAAGVSYVPTVRERVEIATIDSATVATGIPGPLYLVLSVYSWLLVTGSAILLVEFILDRRSLYTKQAAALIGAGVIPLVVSIVDVLWSVGPSAVKLTPMTFALSSGLATLAIVEFDIFRQAPVPNHLASETAVASTDDPTFVLDRGGTVVDCNAAALSLADGDRETLLGRSSEAVTGLGVESGGTVTVETDGVTDYYDVQRTPIYGDGDHTFGAVVTLRDVTERRERKQRLDTLTDVLRATIQEEMTTVQRAVDDGDEGVTDIDTVRERVAAALGVSDRAGELASMAEPEAEQPADIVPIIHEEIDAAREWCPGVSFVLDATLGEWAYCSGLFEPVFRVSLRHAAERSLQEGADPVVGISVNAGPAAVTVSVSDSGRPLSDHERAVLRGEAQPRPSDRADMSRWLVNWGVQQAEGTIRIGTDGEHTSLELTFPRTDASDGQATSYS
ncbi:histidine kinase N-terminal 7TM domain-containing protein [Haloarcula sediminis]|uniref:histidine kinase N-terminal 7TM domain-containing protein n=1 Tax=Haloarcula sediminis TaxID=3111777 RepID=UPI002D79B904|nr:histidine kinase N-terminal 7TM domain-containing protein [Haloarcula sp. CK38]